MKAPFSLQCIREGLKLLSILLFYDRSSFYVGRMCISINYVVWYKNVVVRSVSIVIDYHRIHVLLCPQISWARSLDVPRLWPHWARHTNMKFTERVKSNKLPIVLVWCTNSAGITFCFHLDMCALQVNDLR